MKGRIALAVGLLAAVAAVVAVAVVLFGGGGRSRLSDSYLRPARGPCATFKRSVQPLVVGGGFDDLVRQTKGFQKARAQLAGDLRRLATAADDRRKLEPLFQNLAAGNRALADAQQLEGKAKVAQAFNRLNDYTRLLDAQTRITKRLGLGDCG